MTTPRDDIAGLLDDIKNRRLHHSYPYQLEELATSAATQLDSLLKEREALQARVKELERDVESFQRHEQTLRDNGIASHSEAVVRVVDAESRALRAEQERGEAYERAAIYIEQREGIIPDWRGFVAELRRLAAGPEKDSPPAGTEG